MKFNKKKFEKDQSLSLWLEDETFWNNRMNYLNLLTLFLNNKISGEQFMTNFYEFRNSDLRSLNNKLKELASNINEECLEELASNISEECDKINIEVNPLCFGFSKVMSSLFSVMELYDPETTREMEIEDPGLVYYSMSEDTLKRLIRDTYFPEVKSYCVND